MATTFDTLKFVERLEAGGFTHAQAKAAAEAFADATSQELATKADLRELELRLKHDLTLRLGAMMAAAVAIVAALLRMH